jgi:hypothetical protein
MLWRIRSWMRGNYLHLKLAALRVKLKRAKGKDRLRVLQIQHEILKIKNELQYLELS